VILRSFPRSILEGLNTRAERLTFWINAYNSLVAEGIRALRIRRTVWEAPDFFARIGCRIGDLVFSADDIEHGVLRGNRPHPVSRAVPFRADDPRRQRVLTPPDPRIHFALSCGARSCPPVRAFRPAGLDVQLDAAAREYVKREVTLEEGRLMVSELFGWFREDFDEFRGGLAGFLTHHLEDGPVRRAVREQGVAGMTWRAYDWGLGLSVPAEPDGRGECRWIDPD
jgi:hypothetical protein